MVVTFAYLKILEYHLKNHKKNNSINHKIMITIVYLTENNWMTPRQEKYMWKDCSGLGIDTILVIPNNNYTYINEIPHIPPNSKRVFLESKPHPQSQSLYEYTHPKDATYIFGSNNKGNTNDITKSDDVVHIELNEDKYPWAVVACGIVLYDRRFKHWQSQ